jgi:hypothetical protein
MSWEPLNLAKLAERPPIKPTLGDMGLLYPGKRHVFSGPQESAKTLAAYAIALEVVRRDGAVLLIDFEMGHWDARDRFRELGATDEDFQRIDYVEPEIPATEATILELVDADPTLVIIDAAAGAYDLQGLDDNKRAEVERFAGLYTRRFFLNDIATLLIDHVVKDAKARGRYAIGSERKVGGVDVHLGFEAVKALTRGGSGLVKINTHKDRFGHLPRPKAAELALASDPETGHITWQLRAADPEQPWRPTVLMEKVSRYAEERNGDLPSRNQVEAGIGGNRDYVRQAIDQLLAEDYLAEQEGPRNARLIVSVKPFRKPEDDES